jgi:hypothetical protein
MQSLTQWVLGPVWQSILLIALCYVVPLGDVFAVIMQVFVTLRQGMQKGLVVTLGSTLLGITLGFILGSFFIDVNYLIFVNTLQWALTLSLPLWLFAGILRQTVSLLLTTQILTLVFMALFVITFYGNFHIFPTSLQQPVTENVEKLTDKIISLQQEANSVDSQVIITPENIALVNNFLINIFEIVTIYAMYLVILFLARAWQSVIFQPGGFRQEFINLNPGRLIVTLIVCLWMLLMILPNTSLIYALSGVIFVGAMWLLVTGIAFVHWLISTFQLAWGVVILFYLLLALPIISGILLFILMMIGLIGGFVDLRSFVLKIKSSNN